MGCPHEVEVRPLLEGLLDADATRRMMDHIRGCDDCRSRLEFRGRTEAQPAGAGQAPTYRRYDFQDVENAGRRRPRTLVRGLFAMAAIIGLTWFAAASNGTTPPPRGDPDAEALVIVRAGQGVVRWPEGEIAKRPRAFEVVLPAGEPRRFLIRVSRNGETIYETSVAEGQPGIHFDPLVLKDPRSGETLDARLVMVPFPDEATLPVAAGDECALRIFFGDRPGAATRFRITAGDTAAAGR